MVHWMFHLFFGCSRGNLNSLLLKVTAKHLATLFQKYLYRPKRLRKYNIYIYIYVCICFKILFCASFVLVLSDLLKSEIRRRESPST